MNKQSTLYLMRHLAARDGSLIGHPIQVVGAPEGVTAIVGNGIHKDGKAHLVAPEYVKAEEIGETLNIPKNIVSMLVSSSPKARADESARHMFLGMCKKYAREVLGLDDLVTVESKAVLSEKGLHKLAVYQFCQGLDETDYRDSNGILDKGDELVAQAYCKLVNPDFPGYRWMVQKGFEADQRSEHPQSVAHRALEGLVNKMKNYDLILSASHQPNIEIFTAALTGVLGADANDLWEIAGGSYKMGGGLQLTTTYNAESGLFESARLMRTTDKDGFFDKEIDVDLDVLNHYLRLKNVSVKDC